MYGFPTRKHHYDHKGCLSSRSRQSVLGSLSTSGELKFVEAHNASHSILKSSNHNSPTKSSLNNNYCPPLTTIKSIERGQLNGRLPNDEKYQPVGDRNGIVGYSPRRYSNVIFDSTSSDSSYICGQQSSWNACQNSRFEVYKYYNPAYQPTRWAQETPRISVEDEADGYCIVQEAQLPEVGLPEAKARFVKSSYKNESCYDYSPPPSPPSSTTISAKGGVENSENNNVGLAANSLLEAVKRDDISTAFLLLNNLNAANDIDINYTDSSGRTALSHAVVKGNLAIIEKILRTENVDVNKADNEGNTPLHFVAQAGQMEAASLLLNSQTGLDIDARNHLGFTPLMKAALQGRTKCAKMLLFAGASATTRDTGRGLRSEQWARLCGRYICADMIEKYARNELLSKSASYGNWGVHPELGIHVVNGKLQPSAIALQNAANQQTYQKNKSLKEKIKNAFYKQSSSHSTTPAKVNTYSLVSELTSAALCVSSPVIPNSSRVQPVVKSILKPFVIPKIEITSDEILNPPLENNSSITDAIQCEQQTVAPLESPNPSSHSDSNGTKFRRKLSCFVKLRKK